MAKKAKQRYGNDIFVDVPVFEPDGVTPFKDEGDITVELRNAHAPTIPIPEFGIEDGNVKFWVLASELMNIGSYDLVIQAKREDATIRGGVRTVTTDVRGVIKVELHAGHNL
jgi:hypothetical protein